MNAVVLTGKRGIVAINIINRSLRQRSQSETDNTFGTISQLYVIIRISKCSTQAQLQPFLQLRI